jgi:hypothetical protein
LSSPAPESTDAGPPVFASQLRQLALQLAATLAVLSLAWPYYGLRNEPLPWPQTALAIGATALLFASLTRQALVVAADPRALRPPGVVGFDDRH